MECDKQTSLPQKITVPGKDRTQKVTDKCFTLKKPFPKKPKELKFWFNNKKKIFPPAKALT